MRGEQRCHEIVRVIDGHHSILIVGGGGTIGSSTALHLVRRGYTNVQIMDVYPIPSKQSAGNDLNKIIGTSSSGSRRWISKEIMDGWRTDPVFKPYYHEVGRLEVASLPEHVAALRSRYEKEVADGSLKVGIDVEWLETPEDIVRRSQYLQAGTIQVSASRMRSSGPLNLALTGLERLLETAGWMGSCKGCYRFSRTRIAETWRRDDIRAVSIVGNAAMQR